MPKSGIYLLLAFKACSTLISRIARNGNNLKVLKLRITKICYLYTIEYYLSVKKKNQTMTFVGLCMSDSERKMLLVLSHLWFLAPNLQTGIYCENIIKGMTHGEQCLGKL